MFLFLLQIIIFRLWKRKEKNTYHQFIDRMLLPFKTIAMELFLGALRQSFCDGYRENNQWGIYYFIKHSGAVQIESWCFELTGTWVQAEMFSNNFDIIEFVVKIALALVNKTWLFSRKDDNSRWENTWLTMSYIIF